MRERTSREDACDGDTSGTGGRVSALVLNGEAIASASSATVWLIRAGGLGPRRSLEADLVPWPILAHSGQFRLILANSGLHSIQ